MDKRQEEILTSAFYMSTKLGAAIGSWIDLKQSYLNSAVHAAMDAIIPFFVAEVKSEFNRIEREKSGICPTCGHTEPNTAPQEQDKALRVRR